ncbi:acyl-CoA thioesterase 8, isoform CRA_a [Gaertneriomyces semiglobifer]|nr:acyl-CoA thioesterase 8, isoform CRA_a [Gaertneriomyces semiglobifer]
MTQPESRLKTLIEQALDLEEIDENVYRSKELWLPYGARGVFGGQVVGLALSAATRTVDPKYHVHSLHCYFLLPGDNSIPIVYRVARVRDGKTYATRTVTAQQRGKVIFTLMCSFQVAENSTLVHQVPMPDVIPPEELPSTQEKLAHILKHPKVSKNAKFSKHFQMRMQEPLPIEIRDCQGLGRARDLVYPPKSEPKQYMWMKAIGTLPDDMAFHNCVAAYCSDHYLLMTSVLSHGLTWYSNPGVSMMASLDHSVWFHAPFRADEWLLYEMESTRTVGGRGLCFGRIYTRDGRLVISTAQEGVVRAEYKDVPKGVSKKDDKDATKPKL